jgi:preprotein translocase subunit YajC
MVKIGGNMTTQDILCTVLLVLIFVFLILPSTQKAKKKLDELEEDARKDLARWRVRQRGI